MEWVACFCIFFTRCLMGHRHPLGHVEAAGSWTVMPREASVGVVIETQAHRNRHFDSSTVQYSVLSSCTHAMTGHHQREQTIAAIDGWFQTE